MHVSGNGLYCERQSRRAEREGASGRARARRPTGEAGSWRGLGPWLRDEPTPAARAGAPLVVEDVQATTPRVEDTLPLKEATGRGTCEEGTERRLEADGCHEFEAPRGSAFESREGHQRLGAPAVVRRERGKSREWALRIAGRGWGSSPPRGSAPTCARVRAHRGGSANAEALAPPGSLTALPCPRSPPPPPSLASCDAWIACPLGCVLEFVLCPRVPPAGGKVHAYILAE